jgi:hypothetical protein
MFLVELFSDKIVRIFDLVYQNVKVMTIGMHNSKMFTDGQGTTAQFFTINAICFGLDIVRRSNYVGKLVYIYSNRKEVAAAARDDDEDVHVGS